MKALILAAGIGSRLKPLTDNRPKCMVKVNGKPILFKQLDNLIENGINDITIVLGYKSEMIIQEIDKRYNQVKFIINEFYYETNNMYSTYLASNEMRETEFVLMNADVYFDSSIIKELLNTKYKNSIVVEKESYNDENMKVTCLDGRIIDIGKTISQDIAYGLSIDIYKFNSEGSRIFFNKIKEIIEKKREKNLWTEVALNEIIKKTPFTLCQAKGRWIEIDNLEDLNRAEIMFDEC